MRSRRRHPGFLTGLGQSIALNPHKSCYPGSKAARGVGSAVIGGLLLGSFGRGIGYLVGGPDQTSPHAAWWGAMLGTAAGLALGGWAGVTARSCEH